MIPEAYLKIKTPKRSW